MLNVPTIRKNHLHEHVGMISGFMTAKSHETQKSIHWVLSSVSGIMRPTRDERWERITCLCLLVVGSVDSCTPTPSHKKQQLIHWVLDCLVGKVWSPDFSKFTNINTNAQLVQICRKAEKEPNFIAKKYFWVVSSSFFAKCLHLVPKNSKIQ